MNKLSTKLYTFADRVNQKNGMGIFMLTEIWCITYFLVGSHIGYYVLIYKPAIVSMLIIKVSFRDLNTSLGGDHIFSSLLSLFLMLEILIYSIGKMLQE